MQKKIILLKITGEVLAGDDKQIDISRIIPLANQIKKLNHSHYFGIVIGGGNFFRGSKQGPTLGLTPFVADQIGMLATMMNGLIINDLFQKAGIESSLLNALPLPEVGKPITQDIIKSALSKNKCLIFCGGTGNPFFSTDTTAVLRGLQIEAVEIWKGTNVDGVYSDDPNKNPDSKLLSTISFTQMLNERLKIMDAPAIALAQQHDLLIRVFNIFKPEALMQAAENDTFGSKITP
ncbi:MAG: uridine monophosphate kinase [Candidatus Babeliales bacterium]